MVEYWIPGDGNKPYVVLGSSRSARVKQTWYVYEPLSELDNSIMTCYRRHLYNNDGIEVQEWGENTATMIIHVASDESCPFTSIEFNVHCRGPYRELVADNPNNAHGTEFVPLVPMEEQPHL
jgi:hypothetical protein